MAEWRCGELHGLLGSSFRRGQGGAAATDAVRRVREYQGADQRGPCGLMGKLCMVGCRWIWRYHGVCVCGRVCVLRYIIIYCIVLHYITVYM